MPEKHVQADAYWSEYSDNDYGEEERQSLPAEFITQRGNENLLQMPQIMYPLSADKAALQAE